MTAALAHAEITPDVELRQAAVLAGAGISIDPPSSLPAGGELALRLFDLVNGEDATPFSARAIADLRRKIRDGDLRLEVICDLLALELPPREVVSIFDLLRTGVPNREHLALALLQPATIVTPNQDLLLEKAATLVSSTIRPVHLHGRCDRPATILTTVTDYVHGLSRRATRALENAVRERDLVVLGYSGRDLDIVNALTKSRPQRVLWIEHGTRSPDAELPQGLLDAERHFAHDWTRVGMPTGDWLFEQLDENEQAIVERTLAGLAAPRDRQRRIQRHLEARFERLDPVARALAVGRILRHAGHPDEARAGYDVLRKHHGRDARVQLAWAETTFEMGQFEAAVPVFRKVANNGALPYLRAQAILGEVESRRNMSEYDAARRAISRLPAVLSEIPAGDAHSRVVAATACQRAGLARMNGELDAAEDAYRVAERQSVLAGDVRNALESRTWRAEITLARGRYLQALEESRETLEYAPLTNIRWLTWAKFVYAEALAASGDVRHGLEALEGVLEAFVAYGNEMGEAWSLLAEAMFLRPSDPIGAAHSVAAAESAIARFGGPMVYAKARLYWEAAEVARARRDLVEAARGLSRYRRYVKHQFPAGHVWLEAHGEALGAELARERGRLATAATRARRLAEGYLQIGAAGAARRMELSEWVATNGAEAEPPFLPEWEQNGFVLEVAASRAGRASGYLPLQQWFVP